LSSLDLTFLSMALSHEMISPLLMPKILAHAIYRFQIIVT
jgi:hypothetical protein